MLGVFKRRWKPKRVASDSIRQVVPEGESPERPQRAPPTRQVHPLSAEPNQLAYDTTVRRKTKTLKSATEFSEEVNHLAKKSCPPSPIYPLAQNICVEGGRIEFVKTPPDGATGRDFASPPSTPGANRSFEEEKYDGDKEALEARIRQLERRLEAEASNAQRDRMAVAKLQQQLAKREEGPPRDADVSRGEARAARAEREAERANQRLRAANRELARMEETVRSLLQYKSRAETLKQEKSTLSAALEARSIQYQTSLSRLSAENASLLSQLASLQTAGRCLDDVAAQLVAALLHQKTLREDLTRLTLRARDLEAQNKALGALLLRQLRPRPAPSPASPQSPPQVNDINNIVLNKNNLNPSALNTVQVKSNTVNSTFKKLHMNNSHINETSLENAKRSRLTKSNNDISYYPTTTPNDNAANKKRLSDGNITLPTFITNLSNDQSIISFNDEPGEDIMSVCLSNHSNKLSADDKRRHQILSDLWRELKGIEVTPQSLFNALRSVDPSFLVPPERPLTLKLRKASPNMLSQYLQRLSQTLPDHLDHSAMEDEVAVESPESGNRDEGYSTMSSDVQADPSRQSEPNRELEDLKEASDETDNQILLSINNTLIIEDKTESDILYIPFNLAVRFNQRNSFPPSKDVLPFQHIMRSFSDSHLCLRLTTNSSECGDNCFSLSSPISSSPSVLRLDITPILSKEKRRNPLRRARGTTNLITSSTSYIETATNGSRGSWVSNIDEQVEGCQYDAEYIRHWLQLDDTRSALQQQHRNLLELEYDQAELEDWSLNLSYEDLQEGNWKRYNMLSEVTTPGQISLSTLPSIQEHNPVELEEDENDCLWNSSSYMVDDSNNRLTTLDIESDSYIKSENNHWPYACIENNDMHSPEGSWSSIDNSEDGCLNNEFYDNNQMNIDNELSKRSSAAMSGYSDEHEASAVGTDFTRDFYRLVKFESTKSLASNSSKGVAGNDNIGSVTRITDIQTNPKQDREQALQKVLNFIAEQQMYCHNREELDSLPSRPVSEIHELPPPLLNTPEDNLSRWTDTRSTTGCIYKDTSENEPCDIIISENYKPNYNTSYDLKNDLHIYKQKDEYHPQSFYKRNLKHDENELDQQHLLKVHQKNEINRMNDINDSTSPRNESSTNGTIEGVSKFCEEFNQSNCKNFHINKLKDNQVLCSISAENPICINVINNCESTLLKPVQEEEESSMDNSLIQTSESMTTSVSTSDTIATEIQSDKKRSAVEKSKIPIRVFSPSKKGSQIPIKAKSKIPKVDAQCILKTNGTSELLPTCSANIIVTQGPSHSKIMSFHKSATSKDVIEELNRMIRKGEDGIGGNDNDASCVHTSSLDQSLWGPSGWVHVEQDIDFSDPKARANLLDNMLASSDSSPSPTSSFAGSFSSESSDDRADYSKLHRLHKFKRQKKAAALRDRGLAVLRFSCFHRPTIIGRDDFFVRYGKQERDAVACFDFLEEILPANANSAPANVDIVVGVAHESKTHTKKSNDFMNNSSNATDMFGNSYDETFSRYDFGENPP